MRRSWAPWPWIVVAFALVAAGQSSAHELRIVTSVEGANVLGRVTYAGGEPASAAIVQVLGPNQEVMGQMAVDADGRFEYAVKHRSMHLFRARTPDLHQAESVVGEERLPADLPSFRADPKVEKMFEEAIEEQQTAELSSEIRQLREQVDKLESSIGLRDVVGGIGFIVGILGLLVFWRQRPS